MFTASYGQDDATWGTHTNIRFINEGQAALTPNDFLVRDDIERAVKSTNTVKAHRVPSQAVVEGTTAVTQTEQADTTISIINNNNNNNNNEIEVLNNADVEDESMFINTIDTDANEHLERVHERQHASSHSNENFIDLRLDHNNNNTDNSIVYERLPNIVDRHCTVENKKHGSVNTVNVVEEEINYLPSPIRKPVGRWPAIHFILADDGVNTCAPLGVDGDGIPLTQQLTDVLLFSVDELADCVASHEFGVGAAAVLASLEPRDRPSKHKFDLLPLEYADMYEGTDVLTDEHIQQLTHRRQQNRDVRKDNESMAALHHISTNNNNNNNNNNNEASRYQSEIDTFMNENNLDDSYGNNEQDIDMNNNNNNNNNEQSSSSSLSLPSVLGEDEPQSLNEVTVDSVDDADVHANFTRLRPRALLTQEERTAIAVLRKIGMTVPPLEQRDQIISDIHSVGHFGRTAVSRAIWVKKMWWPRMRDDIERVIGDCEPCQRFTVTARGWHPARAVHASYPMDHIQVDLAFMPVTLLGESAILVVVDVFTGFIWLRTLREQGASSVAKELFDIFCDFGFPRIVQSDNGREFVNSVLQTTCRLFGVNQRLISKYHPQADGKVERVNQTVKTTIVKYFNNKPAQWPFYVRFVQLCYNMKIAELTQSTPMSLMFSRVANELRDYTRKGAPAVCTDMNADRAKWKLHIDRTIASIFPAIELRSLGAQHTYLKRLDALRGSVLRMDLPAGTKVMVANKKFVKGTTKRPASTPAYEGPFYVKKRLDDNGAYILTNADGDEYGRRVTIDQIKVVGGRRQPQQKIDDDIFIVEQLLDHTGGVDEAKEKRQYLTRWAGYEGLTWVPYAQFIDKSVVDRYLAAWKSGELIPLHLVPNNKQTARIIGKKGVVVKSKRKLSASPSLCDIPSDQLFTASISSLSVTPAHTHTNNSNLEKYAYNIYQQADEDKRDQLSERLSDNMNEHTRLWNNNKNRKQTAALELYEHHNYTSPLLSRPMDSGDYFPSKLTLAAYNPKLTFSLLPHIRVFLAHSFVHCDLTAEQRVQFVARPSLTANTPCSRTGVRRDNSVYLTHNQRLEMEETNKRNKTQLLTDMVMSELITKEEQAHRQLALDNNDNSRY